MTGAKDRRERSPGSRLHGQVFPFLSMMSMIRIREGVINYRQFVGFSARSIAEVEYGQLCQVPMTGRPPAGENT